MHLIYSVNKNKGYKVEQKKSQNVDLEDKRLKRFLIGLAVSAALFFVVLELPFRSSDDDISQNMVDEAIQEMVMSQSPDRQDMIAAVEPHAKKAKSEKIKVVEMVKQMKNIADISQQRLVGDADGNGNANNGNGDGKTTDEQDNLAPVAVDMGDNPLNFRIVEQLPEFPGGMSAFVKWLTDNLKYPPSAQRQNIQGRVVITFIINRDGSVADLKVAQSVNPMLDREALRVARMMPRWKPGVANNRPCRTMMAIPIEFKI